MNIKNISKQLLVGLSLSIGILPLVTKTNRSALKKKSLQPLSLYDLCGNWLSEEKNTLLVDGDTQIYFNQERIHLIRKSAQENTLVLQDKFGYLITIVRIDENTLTYYDEAEDVFLNFTKIK